MRMILSWFILLIILVVCRAAPLYNLDEDDNEYFEDNNQKRSLTSEQWDQLDDYFADKQSDKILDQTINRMDNYPNENYVSKRDALWTTTEVLDCIRRIRHAKNISKLDLAAEMLNCYRRMRHSG